MLFLLQNIDTLIPFLGGLYATYLAFRGVPATTTKRAEWERWYATWGRMLKWLGPFLMLFGIAQMVPKLLAN